MIRKTVGVVRKKLKAITQTPAERRHALVGPAHLWKMKQDFQIQFLQSHGLQPFHKLIDIGCGTLRGGIPIIDFLDKDNYYGVDVRSKVIEEGLKELDKFKLQHKNPTVQTFDHFQNLEFKVKFDYMFAFSVLIHLEDKIAMACFEFAGKYLGSDGVFYANVNIGKNEDGKWQGFPIVFRSKDFYESMANENGLTIKQIGTLKELGHDSGQELADQQVMFEIRKTV